MRAVYLEQPIIAGKQLILKGDKVHHLSNVIRIKKNQEILLLAGEGKKFTAKVELITKKEIVLDHIIEHPVASLQYELSLGIAQVKKEALDLILKSCCELGIKKIFILETLHSQNYKLNLERIHKLLISGIEQSNNPWIPELEVVKLSQFDREAFDNIFLFSIKKGEVLKTGSLEISSKNLIVIGPESGFDESELEMLEKSSKVQLIHLPTPIMRASTAVNCAVGYILSRYDLDS